jgi:hypothetical protein
MALTGWIVDKSVATRLDNPRVAEQLIDADGPLCLCEVGLLPNLVSPWIQSSSGRFNSVRHCEESSPDSGPVV